MRTCCGRRVLRSESRVQLRCLTAIVLAVTWVLESKGVWGESKGSLSDAVEQAKKPVEEQEPVQRDPNHAYVALAGGVLLSVLDDDSSSPSAPQPSLATRIGVRSLQMWPTGGALDYLRGGGLSVGDLVSPLVGVEGSVFFLLGSISPTSQAYGAIENPWEYDFEIRCRVYFDRRHAAGDRGLGGVSWSLGVSYAHLGWQYQNPVFATDESGLGTEVSEDSIEGGAILSGITITPIQSRYCTLNVDLGAGWRAYWFWTGEGFNNDIFKNSTFLQASIEFAIQL